MREIWKQAAIDRMRAHVRRQSKRIMQNELERTKHNNMRREWGKSTNNVKKEMPSSDSTAIHVDAKSATDSLSRIAIRYTLMKWPFSIVSRNKT